MDRTTVQDEESQNFYQRHDYKKLPADAKDKNEAEKYCDTVPALQDMPANSVIGFPGSGDTARTRKDCVTRKVMANRHGCNTRPV